MDYALLMGSGGTPPVWGGGEALWQKWFKGLSKG